MPEPLQPTRFRPRIPPLHTGRESLSVNTLQSYARDLARLKAWADTKHKPIEKLERTDLREWIAGMSREGQAPASVTRAVSAARGFFRFLMLADTSSGTLPKISHAAEEFTPATVSQRG